MIEQEHLWSYKEKSIITASNSNMKQVGANTNAATSSFVIESLQITKAASFSLLTVIGYLYECD